MNWSRFRNISLFGVLAFVWGTAYIAIEVGLESLPPVLFAALRYDVASAVLFAYAVAVGIRLRPVTRQEWTYVTLGGVLLIGLHFALLFTGQQYVSSAIGAIVMSLIPVLTPGIALVVLDEHLSPPAVLGVLLGLVGVVIVANPGAGTLDGRLLGVGLVFLSALCFAVGSVLMARFDAGMPVVSMQAWMTLVGAGVLHLLSAALPGESTAPEPGAAAIGAVVYLAVASSAVGLLVYFELLRAVGPTEVSLVNYAVPVVAAVSGWLLLGETIAATTVLGFCVIAAGFALLELRPLYRLVLRYRRHLVARRYAGPGTVAVAGNLYHAE